MSFGPGATIIRAPNGFGKSALLKSLYDTFGAEPHRLDRLWRSDAVISAVDFEIDGRIWTILKSGGTYTVFDSGGTLTFRASSVMQELAPYMAELLDFRLLMTDQRDSVVTPPPAYAFAPYYVDQDKSWSTAWKPFNGMYLPGSEAALADYHSGLKPNAYYVAKAERDRLNIRMREAEVRRRGLLDAVEHLRGADPGPAVFFSLEDFQAETQSLLAESKLLYAEQSRHRQKLNELTEARALWSAQLAVARAASTELSEVFDSASGHPIDVECPTCGEHYSNDIVARFNIAADSNTLLGVMHHAQEQERELGIGIAAEQSRISAIEASIARVREILSVRRGDMSFGDVVAAEGRNAATRLLRARIDDVLTEIGRFTTAIGELTELMRQSLDAARSRLIKSYFSARLTDAAGRLDVRLGDRASGSISKMDYARGSEGPRGLAAYYYAFLSTVREYGSSTFCPIVIDAPNQQGQDDQHLPAIINFLVSGRPQGSQLILGVEDAVGLEGQDAAIVNVGVARNQLLSEGAYEEVARHLRPFLAQLA
jgi:hypothetical protein